jgi:hypothetical protein
MQDGAIDLFAQRGRALRVFLREWNWGRLQATALGLAASFLNQPIEVAELRSQVREVMGGVAWPQLILRFGHPESAEKH